METVEKTDSQTPAQKLLKEALLRNEGILASNGAFSVNTGSRTGRSPKDRFIVDDDTTHLTIDWGTINQPISNSVFNSLWKKASDYLEEKSNFSGNYAIGTDNQYQLFVHVTTELAWHQLFCRHLFVPLKPETQISSAWKLVCAPNLKTKGKEDGVNGDAAILIDFTQERILICGTHYAGEIKKAMFSVMNYLMPDQDVLPMHCSANIGEDGDVALFFGLSGTGKTTLSADPERFLIGDDEHGWSKEGVFNFEGGCYAKCINLSKESEPLIWDAIKDNAIMENVVLDPITLIPNYDDDSLTQNTRAAYPIDHILQRSFASKNPHPNYIIFLTCDLYGVLPPVANLSKTQAAYYFLSGYTALVGSTEVGNENNGIKPVFSRCFGAPFFPKSANCYANLLMKRIEQTDCSIFLVNTGWTGGARDQGGKRFPIPVTRAIVSAILCGQLDHADYETIPYFKLRIPRFIDGVETTFLNPRTAWSSTSSYDQASLCLARAFANNIALMNVSDDILLAGPTEINEVTV